MSGGRITRRRLLAGATATFATAGAAWAEAEKLPRAKGPPVWLDLDQEALDDVYSHAVHAPNMQQILRRLARNSELVRERIGEPKRLTYGTAPAETMDLYAAASAPAPINLFIHGGDWRGGSARDYGFAAEMIVRAGVHFAVPDFSTLQDAGGDLRVLADQLRRAVIWLYKNAQTFGGDPERIYVSGHSSGAHLAAVLLTTDWVKTLDVPPDIIKGGVCASGIYELRPLRLSRHAEGMRFTDEIEQALSPQRHLEKLVAPLVVIYGTAESPELQRQSRHFAAAAQTAGRNVSLVVMEGYNHFEVLEQLGNPLGLFGRSVLQQMKLAP
ncbi:MAG TPA: alpha/beta hydrolase [Xanthobacteraceae bacterium]|nr:alpha/beta hydrolase [Xanthobacteraceae bacterium]